ncbi:S-layer homology domain-containing protein [Metasolibacillus meyeri]|uniref:S-layer homology domain-containing protein n=1 Tax=Metasolibacillus meyeri TaxID=1071052 RepID=A0AAW9NVS0_9BACL|nr:S-layer homology domain-containing protein [Metasolibacillus meyeri]MEC1179559.1 S-layer homology domain-containing protein [Metasolibacillus meyeri]
MLRSIFNTFVIIACLFMLTTLHAEASGFKDVPKDHFAYNAVLWAQKYEIINGYSDGTFKPSETITEQQFAKLLANYFELDTVENELKKQTTQENWSDVFYDSLASYGVPLNGYLHNTIRSQPVKRGVVAQAIAHLADGKHDLNSSIEFLLEHYISTGQNPKYENRDLQKFFGTTNNMTRAQVVTLLYRMDSMDFYYISDDAEATHENVDNLSLNERATQAKKRLDTSLQQNPSNNSTWHGNYRYVYQWGKGAYERNARYVTISNATSKDFYVKLSAYDGKYEGTTEGYAVITSAKKAIMQESSKGNRCIIEFEHLNNAIKVTEIDCSAERTNGTNFSGTLRKQ